MAASICCQSAFDRSGADLTAHAVRAWLSWLPILESSLRESVLAAVGKALQFLSAVQRWLMRKIESHEWLHPAPIGFYSVRLWYYERLYPMIFTVAALGNARRARHGLANIPKIRPLDA